MGWLTRAGGMLGGAGVADFDPACAGLLQELPDVGLVEAEWGTQRELQRHGRDPRCARMRMRQLQQLPGEPRRGKPMSDEHGLPGRVDGAAFEDVLVDSLRRVYYLQDARIADDVGWAAG